jgi:hypothetical protein
LAGTAVIDIDERVLGWVRDAIDVTAVLAAPTPKASPGVSVHLLDVEELHPRRGADPAPRQAWLRYLVVPTSSDVASAHEQLARLLVAAMDRDDLEVVYGALSPELWIAFDVPPQAALVVRALLEIPRDDPPAELVRQPLVIEPAFMGSFAGVVLGPGDHPILDATVELQSGVRARTDVRGRFRLPVTPSLRDGTATLTIRSRGRTYRVRATQTDEPLVVRLDLQED